MDRLITRTSWSLQSRRCRTGGRGGACHTGTRGVLQRSVRHEARHIREARLASTLADGQGRRRQCRRFLLPCTMGLRPRRPGSASGKSSFNALCLPSWPDTNFSPLLISRKAPCGPSSRTLRAARRPHWTARSSPASRQSRGWFQDTHCRVLAPAQGVLGLGSQTSP